MKLKRKELLKRAIIPVCVLGVAGFCLWMHYEAVTQDIFVDYGIEPFESTGCKKALFGLPLTRYGQ